MGKNPEGRETWFTKQNWKNKLIFKKVMLQSRADCLKILELSLVESAKASHRPVWTPEAPGDN